jgi:hypothetical protein
MLRLWPNPVSNTLHVQAEETLTGAVEVLDATGRVVLRERVAGRQVVLEVSLLGPGLYTLRCSTDQGAWCARFVKH